MTDAQAPMQQVFVSHSRKDFEGQLFLSHVFDLPGSRYRPMFYSVEDPTPPHAPSILKHIQESTALVVLLSKELATKGHTHSWVSFEVGAAAHRGIPVFVIEPESIAPLPFTVPGTTHYAQRPAIAESIGKTFWSAVARESFEIKRAEYVDTSDEGLGGKILGFFYNIAQSDTSLGERFVQFKCRHGHCKAGYFVESGLTEDEFPCPVCRHLTATPTIQAIKAGERFSERETARVVTAREKARRGLPPPSR